MRSIASSIGAPRRSRWPRCTPSRRIVTGARAHDARTRRRRDAVVVRAAPRLRDDPRNLDAPRNDKRPLAGPLAANTDLDQVDATTSSAGLSIDATTSSASFSATGGLVTSGSSFFAEPLVGALVSIVAPVMRIP